MAAVIEWFDVGELKRPIDEVALFIFSPLQQCSYNNEVSLSVIISHCTDLSVSYDDRLSFLLNGKKIVF